MASPGRGPAQRRTPTSEDQMPMGEDRTPMMGGSDLPPGAGPSYDDVVSGLSPETQGRLRNGPPPEEAKKPAGVAVLIHIAPGPRYGRKGPEEAPATTEEGRRMPGLGYSRGIKSFGRR